MIQKSNSDILLELDGSSIFLRREAMAFIAASESLSEQLDRAKHAIGMPQEEADVAANAKKATWPPISNSLTREKAKEISKSVFPFSRTF